MLVRNMEILDIFDVFNWRNDFLTREMSLNQSTITLCEHIKWTVTSLTRLNRRVYIGIKNSDKIGACSFNYKKSSNTSEVSINLNPSMRGKNLATSFLLKSIDLFKTAHGIRLTATIKKNNISSLKIFQNCGFSILSEDLNVYYLVNY